MDNILINILVIAIYIANLSVFLRIANKYRTKVFQSQAFTKNMPYREKLIYYISFVMTILLFYPLAQAVSYFVEKYIM